MRDAHSEDNAERAHDWSGQTVGERYIVEERIGFGGMGEVYRGRHLHLNRPVAIKLLRPNPAYDLSASAAHEAGQRFLREAKRTARIDHPNCVRVTDFGVTADDAPYLVMEYLDGRTLAQELAVDGPMKCARLVHVARQVAEVLAKAHDGGIVHRDLKPGNVMLLVRDGDPDFVKVLDFGLAKLLPNHVDAAHASATSLAPLTRHGIVLGTPEYMSPEQAMDGDITPAADIYSLGVCLYEMLVGKVPFTGANAAAIIAAHVEAPVPAPEIAPDCAGLAQGADHALRADLVALMMTCLAKSPDDRPRNMHAVADALAAMASAYRHETNDETRAASAGDIRAPASDHAPLMAVTLPAPTRVAAQCSSPRVAVPPTAMKAGLAPSRARLKKAAAIGCAAVAAVVTAAWLGILLGESVSPGPSASSASARATASRAYVPSPAKPALTEITAAAVPQPATEHAPKPDDDGMTAVADRPRGMAARSALPSVSASVSSSGAASKSTRRMRLQRHLRAARAAGRDKNWLRQMAEADSALRIAPKHRQAALLLGEALLHSGDTSTACRYLHQAGTLAGARALRRRAACKGD